jgi:hypothetical protein
MVCHWWLAFSISTAQGLCQIKIDASPASGFIDKALVVIYTTHGQKSREEKRRTARYQLVRGIVAILWSSNWLSSFPAFVWHYGKQILASDYRF